MFRIKVGKDMERQVAIGKKFSLGILKPQNLKMGDT